MKRGRKTTQCFIAVVLAMILLSLVGCGGSGQSGSGGQLSSPDFSLSLSSTSLSLTGGSSAQVNASMNGTNGFTTVVTLQISGLPTGITYSPSTLQVNPGSSVKVTFNAATGAPAYQGNVTLTGTSGTLSHGVTLNLTVTATSNSSQPVLSQIFPSSTVVGVPQGFILLTGRNFTPSSTVLFDGARAGGYSGSSTSIQVQLDTSIFGVAKSHTVQVSDSSTGNSNVLTYDVYSPQGGPLSFAGQPGLPFSTAQAALADVNGDGRSDLITLDTAAGTNSVQISIRVGQQDGTLSTPVAQIVTLAHGIPGRVLAGDLTAHGHIDLILVYPSSYQVLLNDGLANFTPAGSGALPGSNFGRGAVGDFNGDGKLDFIIDTGDTGGPLRLAVLFGHGDGTFETPVQLGSGSEKVARVEAVDLNGDGITDIVYATYILSGSDTLDMHTLVFHSGGTFTDSLTAGVTGPSWSFVAGDFNNDRIPDLFVVNGAGTGQAFFGKGDGTFSSSGRPVAASDGFLVTPPFVAGDFDHDGNIDVATRLTTVGPDVLLFLWGDGQGNFTSQIIASDNSFYLFTGDVNGDGIPDIFATGGFGYISVTLGRNNRNFPSSKLLLNAPLGTLSSGNVFNDGYQDILVSGNGDCANPQGTPGAIYHIQANGAPIAKGSAPACTSVLVDLDGDGIADLVGISQPTVSARALYVWKGDGSGAFQGPVTVIPAPGSSDIRIQDFVFRDMDGDGHTDIVIAGAILYGTGNLQFNSVPLPGTLDQRFLVGDFDGDGIPDIVTSSGVLFGQGNRTFTVATGSAPACWSAYLRNPAVGDLNGDGKDDIVCGTTSAPLVEIYDGAGRSGFTQNQVLAIPGGSIVYTVSLGDFSADGRLDIAVGTLGGDDVVLFTNDGNGEYQISSYAIGVSPIQSIVRDFNKDGAPDLAFMNYGYDYKPTAVEVLLHK